MKLGIGAQCDTWEQRHQRNNWSACLCNFHNRKWPNWSATKLQLINCVDPKTTLTENLSEGPYFVPKLYSLDNPLLGNSLFIIWWFLKQFCILRKCGWEIEIWEYLEGSDCDLF